jgi:hypothetical protein
MNISITDPKNIITTRRSAKSPQPYYMPEIYGFSLLQGVSAELLEMYKLVLRKSTARKQRSSSEKVLPSIGLCPMQEGRAKISL